MGVGALALASTCTMSL